MHQERSCKLLYDKCMTIVKINMRANISSIVFIEAS